MQRERERERERELKKIVEGFSFLIYRTLGSWQRDSLCAYVSRVRCLCVYMSIENQVFLLLLFFFKIDRIKYLWGAKTRTFMLSFKPYLLTIMRLRRGKCWEMPHSRWLYREMLKDTSPRGSFSSDLMNVSQVNFALTQLTFQEIPATKIDFRCARK